MVTDGLGVAQAPHSLVGVTDFHLPGDGRKELDMGAFQQKTKSKQKVRAEGAKEGEELATSKKIGRPWDP